MGDSQPIHGYSVPHTPTHGFAFAIRVLVEPRQVKARSALSENLTWLMSQRPDLSTPAAVEAATIRNNCKVGRSTVDRAKNELVNLTIENLEAIATVYGREAWELLRPDLAKTVNPPTSLEGRARRLDSLLPTVSAEDLEGLGDEDRQNLSKMLKDRAGELRLLAQARATVADLQHQANAQ